MISYKQAINVLKTFATAHKQVKRFDDEFREQMPNDSTEEISFPYMFAEPVDSLGGENINDITLNIYCVDRLRKDRENTGDVVSDTLLILSDLSRWLEEGQEALGIVEVYPATPVNNYLLDYVSGWVMKITVEVERVALCEIPIAGVTPGEDPVSTVENSDASYTQTIPCGDTLVLPDSTVSNSDDTYLVALPATTDLELPDITVTDSDGSSAAYPSAKDVVCTPVVSIPTSKLMKTGQTVSYRTGDDGGLEEGRPTDFNTLSQNNPFGNLNRFTDELGTQLYVNDIVIDWSTYDGADVLGWYRVLTISTWNAAIDASLALTVAGFAVWRLANFAEMHSLFDWTYTGTGAYAPLNFALNRYWTSTTPMNATTKAMTFNSTIIGVTGKTGSSRYSPCRTFTNAELGI